MRLATILYNMLIVCQRLSQHMDSTPFLARGHEVGIPPLMSRIRFLLASIAQLTGLHLGILWL